MKLLYCMLGLSMAACTPQKTVNGGEDELSMLIGTYTDGTSKGIYSFRFNQKTGTATPLELGGAIQPVLPHAIGRR